jgi:uncharacterized membrane protein
MGSLPAKDNTNNMGEQITRSIIVNGQVPELYQAWLDFGNHPQFMENVTAVSRQGPDIHRWRMEGPLDTELEWTTRTTREELHRRIAWKTIEGELKSSGQVTFTPLPQGQTEITVTTLTVPPENLIQKAADALLVDEAGQLDRDLRNFKAMIENRS